MNMEQHGEQKYRDHKTKHDFKGTKASAKKQIKSEWATKLWNIRNKSNPCILEQNMTTKGNNNRAKEQIESEHGTTWGIKI
jgi:hypothetical protein